MYDNDDSLGGVFGDVGSAVQDVPAGNEGTGGSPDGLGAYAMPAGDPNQPAMNTSGYNYEPPASQGEVPHSQYAPQLPPAGGGAIQSMPHDYQPPQHMMPGQMPMAGPIEFLEPPDASPQAAVRSAGITALTSVVAAGAGFAAGGPIGAISGVLISGSAFNLYRGQKWFGSPDPSEKHEAVTSIVMALAGGAAGAFAAYKAYEERGEVK